MAIRIVLCDDHTLFLEGLAALLARDPNHEIVGKAKNGIEAIALIKTAKPDVAILDLSMPGANGLEVFTEARRWSPRTRFIVLTGTILPNLLHQIEAAGVSGLFLKSAPPQELAAAIATVAAGGRSISADVRALHTDTHPARLSPRELEVLHAIARGLSNPQIAEALGISPKTVDSHRTSLMAKMKARSTAMLLVAAMRRGLIDVEAGTPESTGGAHPE